MMWETIKKIAAAIGAGVALIVGLLLFTRRSQSKNSESALTPEKQKEISNVENKIEQADQQAKQNHATIEALEVAIQQNNGKLDGVAKEVEGMTQDEVRAELQKRGLI